MSLNTAEAPKNDSDAKKYIKADDSPENTWDGLTWMRVSANSRPSFRQQLYTPSVTVGYHHILHSFKTHHNWFELKRDKDSCVYGERTTCCASQPSKENHALGRPLRALAHWRWKCLDFRHQLWLVQKSAASLVSVRCARSHMQRIHTQPFLL